MKIILLKFLHYVWFKKNNIYSFYKSIRENPNIKFDGNVSPEEFIAVREAFSKSGATFESFDDENIVSWDIIWTKIQENTSKNLVENDQGPIDCVPRAIIRMIRLNTSIDISQNKEQEYIDDMYAKRIIAGTWSQISVVQNYIKNAILRDFWKELVYFKTPYGSTQYNELMDKWYAHAMWGWLTDMYIADFVDDWDIDIWNYTFREKIQYYHVFTHLPKWFLRWNIVENYKTRFWVRNIYKNNYVQKFASRGVFFWYAYFFVEKISVAVHEERLQAEKDAIQASKDSWTVATELWLVSGEDRDKNVTRYEVAVIVVRAIKLLLKEFRK